MDPNHLRLDFALAVSRAVAVHDEECPDIGPICQVRPEPPQQHHITLWLAELWVLAEYGIAPHFALQGVVPLREVEVAVDLAADGDGDAEQGAPGQPDSERRLTKKGEKQSRLAGRARAPCT